MDVAAIVTICGCAVSVASFFLGRMTSAKNSGQEYGVMLTDIGYIKSGIDDMKKKMEQSDKRYIDLEKRVTALEESVKIYHHKE